MKPRKTIGLMFLAMTLMVYTTSRLEAAELISCPDLGNSGDNLRRGFYTPSYPGSTLDQVDLQFSPTIAGEYTIRLTVRRDSYDGSVIGTVDVTETLTLLNPAHNPVTFFFPELSVTPSSTVTFFLEMIDGPEKAACITA